MASCRDSLQEAKSRGQSLQEAKSRGQSLQEAKSRGQSLQEAIYQAQQSLQEARDCRQSRRKPNMTDSLCRKRKLADWFVPCGNVYEKILAAPLNILSTSSVLCCLKFTLN